MAERYGRLSNWHRTTLLSVGCFALFFGLRNFISFPFWILMALISGGCAATALWMNPGARDRLRRDVQTGLGWKLALGIASAVVLYGIFAAGNSLSRAWFSRAGENIDRVYRIGDGVSPVLITFWIAGMIAPAEEVLWRVCIQQDAPARLPAVRWLLVAGLYALVHAPSANPMLFVAAAVCGLFWGALYLWKQSPVVNIVSHIVWDLAVFVWFPLKMGT